jgi:hypothetical protein
LLFEPVRFHFFVLLEHEAKQFLVVAIGDKLFAAVAGMPARHYSRLLLARW